jgi:hypothetical protein
VAGSYSITLCSGIYMSIGLFRFDHRKRWAQPLRAAHVVAAHARRSPAVCAPRYAIPVLGISKRVSRNDVSLGPFIPCALASRNSYASLASQEQSDLALSKLFEGQSVYKSN